MTREQAIAAARAEARLAETPRYIVLELGQYDISTVDELEPDWPGAEVIAVMGTDGRLIDLS